MVPPADEGAEPVGLEPALLVLVLLVVLLVLLLHAGQSARDGSQPGGRGQPPDGSAP